MKIRILSAGLPPWWLSGRESTCSAGDMETQVPSLGREDPLEQGLVIHSSNLAWKVPQTEEPGGLQSNRVTRESDTTQQLKQFFLLPFIAWV